MNLDRKERKEFGFGHKVFKEIEHFGGGEVFRRIEREGFEYKYGLSFIL